MWRIFILIAFSVFACAKEMPIMQNIEIYIPYREFFIAEFPFEIKDKKFSPFIYKAEVKKEDPLKNKVKLPGLEKKKKKKKNLFFLSRQKPFKATSGKNFVQIYPTKVGKTELTIWGYRKFPLMITFVVTKNKEIADKYIKFIDYEAENETFKSSTHEKICKKLIYNLYNNITPRGYKNVSVYKKTDKGGLEMILIRELRGKRYRAMEFNIKNKKDKTIKLNEPMFASEDVYAVTIENRVLKPSEATRIFIVSRMENETKYR